MNQSESPSCEPSTQEMSAAADRFWAAVLGERADLQGLESVPFMERLNALLEPCVPGVTVEVAGAGKEGPVDGQARLVFTAHGSAERFADVQALTAQAPAQLPWRVEAFRQRMPGGFGMRMDGFDLATHELLVRVGQIDGRIALALSFSKPVPMDLQDHARHMAFILLDHMLGEYDFSVKVGVVEFDTDGLSDDAGFEDWEPASLDDSVSRIDTFWRETLGRSAVYPPEPVRWAALEGRDAQGDPIMVQVNLSANALVSRADLGWRVQASLPAQDKSALQQAQDFEDAWVNAATMYQQGICSHIVLRGGTRTVHCYVTSADHALEAARRAAEAVPGMDPPVLEAEHEPAWNDYLGWYVECRD